MDPYHKRQLYWNIATKVGDLRWTKRLTQAELAEQSGLSRFQINRIEGGRGDVTIDTLHRLSQFFEIPLVEFFTKIKREPIEIKIRPEKTHSSDNDLQDIYYARVFHGSTKIRKMHLPPWARRPFKTEVNYIYDVYLFEGKLRIGSPYYEEKITLHQIVSVRGSGDIYFQNASDKVAEFLLIQAVADEVFDDRGVGEG